MPPIEHNDAGYPGDLYWLASKRSELDVLRRYGWKKYTALIGMAG